MVLDDVPDSHLMTPRVLLSSPTGCFHILAAHRRCATPEKHLPSATHLTPWRTVFEDPHIIFGRCFVQLFVHHALFSHLCRASMVEVLVSGGWDPNDNEHTSAFYTHSGCGEGQGKSSGGSPGRIEAEGGAGAT